VWLLKTLGAEVRLVAPATLLPIAVDTWPVTVDYDLDHALAESTPDVIMMLRIQQERMNQAFFPNPREYANVWGLSTSRWAALPATSLVMHPGPMNRGLEISSAAADSPQSTVLEQVSNGVAVRMATLYTVLTGNREVHA
ncbi:MAG: aspartate carbamoyltransferase, partial [Actinomycetales bacterium]|nr:aspartate carbamoyltransferase [Actinomycetales bacterium]